jgi:hypothetical protein
MDQMARPEGRLAKALLNCGANPELVDVEWDQDCQEDIITFQGDPLPGATLAKLAWLYLSGASQFVFPSADEQEAFERALSNNPLMRHMREHGATLDSLWSNSDLIDELLMNLSVGDGPG